MLRFIRSLVVAGLWMTLVNTSIECATRPHFSIHYVSDFSALGDGNADDGPAIERAILATNKSGGGEVRLPCGDFHIAHAVGNAPGSRSLLYVRHVHNVKLTGLGRCTHLFSLVPQKSVLEFEDSDGIIVSNLRISAVNAIYVETYGMGGGSAIRFSGVKNGSITNVEVDGAAAGAIYLTKGTSDSLVSNNYIHDTYGSGIWEDDCGSMNAHDCAPASPPLNNVYRKNTLVNTSLSMTTAIVTDNGGASTHTRIEGNSISWSRAPLDGYEQVHCIQVGHAADVSVVKNQCIGTPYDAIVVTTGNGTSSRRITIQRNIVRQTGSSKYGGTGIVVYGDPTGGEISEFTIEHNIVAIAKTDGIRLVSAGERGSVHDGRVEHNVISMPDQLAPGTRFGIDVEHCVKVEVVANRISCGSRCVAAGINIVDLAGNIPGSGSNRISKITGPELRIQ